MCPGRKNLAIDENTWKETLVQAPGKLIDGEHNHLDNLHTDNLVVMRKRGVQHKRELRKRKQKWLQNGHGTYSQLADEDEFFESSEKSPDIVCHFYRDGNARCRVIDNHLKVLAGKHIEAKFCKVNVEKSPFLSQRLRMKVIPTIVVIKNGKIKDFIVGFTDLGNCENFSTGMVEWRLAQSGIINYKGDLMTPPIMKRKFVKNRAQMNMRGGYEPDDSETDSDD
ncbi:thioredoxin domain-containing protein 9-like [Glossina fuscipes]|uniref:Thioredoxin domain-containing protein 9-like n=1 Tax=Glossina fuscipes TaxID=7396 RepID=A0A8U0W8N5_9MUSC|nr:thioredoxin domain-containing protein 9-like [Glossina fuscipes]